MKNMKQFYVFNIICTIVTCKKKMTLTNKKIANGIMDIARLGLCVFGFFIFDTIKLSKMEEQGNRSIVTVEGNFDSIVRRQSIM